MGGVGLVVCASSASESNGAIVHRAGVRRERDYFWPSTSGTYSRK